jgi:hypothetical protein
MTRLLRFAAARPWLGWLLFTPFLAVVLFWMLDRTPPFQQVGPAKIENIPRPGGAVVLSMPVRRQLSRDCSVHFYRHLFDGGGHRIDNVGEGFLTADGLRVQASRMGPDWMRLTVPIPAEAQPGSALLVSQLEYSCNPVHSIWPIQVNLLMPFKLESRE